MARVATAAVLHGHILPIDAACLSNWFGETRVLSAIAPLLCDIELGRTVNQKSAKASLNSWCEEYGRLKSLISAERSSLEEAARKASDALTAASAALECLLEAQSKATLVGMCSIATPTFRSLPLASELPLTPRNAREQELFKMKEWAAELAQSLAYGQVDRFAFPALDLPMRDRLDSQQQSALDTMMSRWCPEFDPPSLCDVCGWPELECHCDVELVDLQSTFELRDPSEPPLVVTERGWAVKRPRATAPSWPGSRDPYFAINAALDAVASSAEEALRPAPASQPLAVATELPQPTQHSSHLESPRVSKKTKSNQQLRDHRQSAVGP